MGRVDLRRRAGREHPERFRQQLRQANRRCARHLDAFGLRLRSRLRAAQTKTAATFNATDPDLSRFAARGGKLILYHGWSDAAIPAQGTIDYRDNVVRRMGAKRAGEFVRLFMVPGMHHCAGGTGPSDFGQNAVPVAGRQFHQQRDACAARMGGTRPCARAADRAPAVPGPNGPDLRLPEARDAQPGSRPSARREL